jgi:hypothetical protein
LICDFIAKNFFTAESAESAKALNVKTQCSLFEKSSDTLKARAPSGDAGGSNRAEGTRLEEQLEFESKNSAHSALHGGIALFSAESSTRKSEE